MKRFLPLIIWMVVSLPLLYFVRNVLIYKYPEHEFIIMSMTLLVVFGAFFMVKDHILKKK